MIRILAVCLMGIVVVPLTAAQTRIKCFDTGFIKSKAGVILDCSNTAGNNPYTVEDWIRYHAFYDVGILANRVLHINLDNNNLQQIFTLPAMLSLKKLSYRNNNITSIEHKALSNLPALEELDISYNSLDSYELSKIVFRRFRRPNVPATNDEAELKVLKLGNNNIHSLPPNCFQYLTKLEMLELSYNPLLVIDQNTEISLGYLTNLQVLDLGNTGISDFPAETFSRLSNVQTLYINGNQFRKIPKEIRNMPLAYLNMNANPVGELDAESFVGLDQLQELIISGMPNLTDVGSGAFVPLKKLVTLHMSYNPSLTNVHHDAFADSTAGQQWSLRQLSIRNTNVSTLDSKLYPWSMLDLFDAQGNPWTCDCRLSWLADYINETFAGIPEALLYYRCTEPKSLTATLVSQLNEHIDCDDFAPTTPHFPSTNHSHGHATRLRHFVIVIGLVIGIFAFGSLINMGCRELKKVLKPRINVPARFTTSDVKYRPADFEDDIDPLPAKNATINGRSPIVINNTD